MVNIVVFNRYLAREHSVWVTERQWAACHEVIIIFMNGTEVTSGVCAVDLLLQESADLLSVKLLLSLFLSRFPAPLSLFRFPSFTFLVFQLN